MADLIEELEREDESPKLAKNSSIHMKSTSRVGQTISPVNTMGDTGNMQGSHLNIQDESPREDEEAPIENLD